MLSLNKCVIYTIIVFIVFLNKLLLDEELLYESMIK